MVMRKVQTILLSTLTLLCGVNYNAYCQDQISLDSSVSQLSAKVQALEEESRSHRSGDSHFMVVGLMTFGYVNDQNKAGGVTTTTNSLADADHFEFSPMLLWRQSNKVLLEFEPSFTGNSLGVNWADVSYFAAPGLIIRAGYFVLPFGIYNKRLAAGWINKIAGDPIGISSMPPSSDFGVEVEGGLPMGNMKWSYDVSLTNGMQLLPDGTIQSVGVTDNNNNRTVTGRLALLPFSNSSLEVGISGMFGNVGDANSVFKNASTNMYAVDLSYVKRIKKFLFNVKGQYNMINISKQDYTNPTDSTQTFSFTNTTTALFAQVSARPAFLKNKILKNFELAFRYANYITPDNSAWQQNVNETDIGICYWTSWRSVLKFTYEIINTNVNDNPAIGVTVASTTDNKFYLQFSTEF